MAGFVTKDGEEIVWSADNPGSLAAWFGNFGHAEHFRKVLLASCREAERGKVAKEGGKLTVDRCDDLARTSDKYVQYLIDTLNGRVLYEQNVLASMVR